MYVRNLLSEEYQFPTNNFPDEPSISYIGSTYGLTGFAAVDHYPNNEYCNLFL
jgi:hypothetical protein